MCFYRFILSNCLITATVVSPGNWKMLKMWCDEDLGNFLTKTNYEKKTWPHPLQVKFQMQIFHQTNQDCCVYAAPWLYYEVHFTNRCSPCSRWRPCSFFSKQIFNSPNLRAPHWLCVPSPVIVISFWIAYWHSYNDLFSSLYGQAVGFIIVFTLYSLHTSHMVTHQPCIISSNVSVNQSRLIATFVLVRHTHSSTQCFLLLFLVLWLEWTF